MNNTVLILDNLRSIHNVGSFFRTADAIGVQEIALIGDTPLPIDRFGRPVPALAKVALGAEQTILWKHFVTVAQAIQYYKRENYLIIAVEQSLQAQSYKTLFSHTKKAFLFGTEVSGCTQETLELCDHCIEIPMHGNKESLNVAVAGGIVLYTQLDR
jgi:23S rRNA (guanosine2251-2'-O)-methyltransferase